MLAPPLLLLLLLFPVQRQPPKAPCSHPTRFSTSAPSPIEYCAAASGCFAQWRQVCAHCLVHQQALCCIAAVAYPAVVDAAVL